MRALDAFLLTSHWEGLARVLLEARAAAVPVVATRVGGAEEAITDGRHGRLCEAGDIEGLADRLCEVLAACGEGASGREGGDLPAEFESCEMVRQVQQLYDKLLANLSKEHLAGQPPDLARRAQ
jgi:glycosyltransferase involved in cell wall biosynthesis